MAITTKRDPLLAIARVGTILARIAFVVGMIGLGIAAAVNVVDPALLTERLRMDVQPELNEVTGAVLVVIFLGLFALGLMYDFVTRLAQIIDTVGKGDPFTRENAGRLKRMGYLALAVQVLGIMGDAMSNWLQPFLKDGAFELHSDATLSGLCLAIILFILARVFAKGSEMREELEGTV